MIDQKTITTKILAKERFLRILPSVLCIPMMGLTIYQDLDNQAFILIILVVICGFGLKGRAGNVFCAIIVSGGAAIFCALSALFFPQILSHVLILSTLILSCIAFIHPNIGDTTYELMSSRITDDMALDIVKNQEMTLRHLLPISCKASKIQVDIIKSQSGILIHKIHAMHQDGQKYSQSLLKPLDKNLGFLNLTDRNQVHILPARSAHFIMNGLKKQAYKSGKAS